MGATPQTIVVSSNGIVLASWNGAFLGRQKDTVEKLFNVRLPEVNPEKPARAART